MCLPAHTKVGNCVTSEALTFQEIVLAFASLLFYEVDSSLEINMLSDSNFVAKNVYQRKQRITSAAGRQAEEF